jgi:hypothetical protein
MGSRFFDNVAVFCKDRHELNVKAADADEADAQQADVIRQYMHVMMHIECSDLNPTEEVNKVFPLPQMLQMQMGTKVVTKEERRQEQIHGLHFVIKCLLCLIQYHSKDGDFKNKHKLNNFHAQFGVKKVKQADIAFAVLEFCENAPNLFLDKKDADYLALKNEKKQNRAMRFGHQLKDAHLSAKVNDFSSINMDK